ncbi:hypothetical protein B0H17DRAFT_1212019 [Mycena rosella]|uniref:Uncharacterized protein n=1 Tax=Mycena rosella TaxID=1033263 RepID=A0AAD7CTM3_MYCRO|nr:hypothetical protein B0H17DRAFT_1212019 [Mycena rosella]
MSSSVAEAAHMARNPACCARPFLTIPIPETHFRTLVSLAVTSFVASVAAAPVPANYEIPINIHEAGAPRTSPRIHDHTSLTTPIPECHGPCFKQVHCSSVANCKCEDNICKPTSKPPHASDAQWELSMEEAADSSPSSLTPFSLTFEIVL